MGLQEGRREAPAVELVDLSSRLFFLMSSRTRLPSKRITGLCRIRLQSPIWIPQIVDAWTVPSG